MPVSIRGAGRRAHHIRTDERGTVAVLFALLAIPFFGIAGVALDYGRALKLRTTLQAAADAATSAGLQRLGQGREALHGALRASIDANLPDSLQGTPFQYQIIGDDEGVSVQVEASIATTLARLFGHDKFEIKAESSASRPKAAQGAIASASQARAGRPSVGAAPRNEEEARRLAEEIARRLHEMASNGGPSRGQIEELRTLLGR